MFISPLSVRYCVAWAGFSLACSLPVLAQNPPLPSGAEIGRTEQRPLLPTISETGTTIRVPQSSAAEAPLGAEKYRLLLNSVHIEGVSVFDSVTLRSLYASYLLTDVNVATLYQVANALEVKYRQAGYVSSRVVVPEQTIENGIFKIQVLEGFVSEIVYNENIGPARAALETLMQPLLQQKPINIAEIERRLLLANDLSGLQVRANMQAATDDKTGASVLVVDASRKPMSGSFSADNRGSPYMGDNQFSSSLTVNSMGRHADTLTLSASITSPWQRSVYGGLQYQALINQDGAMASLSASRAHSEPGLTLDELDVKSNVVSFVGTFTYPVIRSRQQNLRAVAELEIRDMDTSIGPDPFNRDALRIARVGISYDRADSWNGITALRTNWHQGLPIFGATKKGDKFASRATGDGTFSKITLDLTRVQQLTTATSLLARATVQHASTTLLASEQIALGGGNYGRGYDAGEISSDNGWAASIEWRYSPGPTQLLPHGSQLYTFIDGGEVSAQNAVALNGPSKLASYGFGVRANLSPTVLGSIEASQPAEGNVSTLKDKPTRLFMSLTAQF
jgi:hemolysin activation/secretion protein